MFVLNAYFCRELRFVAILRFKLRFLLRNTQVDSDFTQNFWGKNWRLKSLVRTTFGGVFTALIIILACAFLSPYLAFIPTAALSAVIVYSMFFTINYSMPKDLWKAKSKHQYPVNITTNITCRIGLVSLYCDVPPGSLLERGDGLDSRVCAPPSSPALSTI